MSESQNVRMARNGQEADVHVGPSVEIMEKLGWKTVDGNDGPKAPADMTAADLKAELDAVGASYKGNASKADLVDLVTELRAAKARESQS